MRIRRRLSRLGLVESVLTRLRSGRLWERLFPQLPPEPVDLIPPRPDRGPPELPVTPAAPEDEDGAAADDRRPGPPGGWDRLRAKWRGSGQEGRRFRNRVWYGTSFLVFLLMGWVAATFVLFPAPLFSSDRPTPRVIGLPQDRAEAVLANAGLRTVESGTRSHATAPRGTVVWQDPPDGVMAPLGTTVRLTVSSGQPRIPVPDVVGYYLSAARLLLQSAGLVVSRIDSVQWAAPRGVVVNTRPAAGATRSPGASITLFVSAGTPTISVPDLRGLTVEVAQDSLEAAGLVLGTWWQETSLSHPIGYIFRQDPPVGTLTAPETPVNVVVARR